MIPNRSQEAMRSHLMVPDGNGDDDDMEIIIVSDTVRQRRSRTPSSSTSLPNDTHIKESKSCTNQMPDLLPKTFHLAESSALFSQVNRNFLSGKNSIANSEQKVSVVEVREANLSTPKRVINTYLTGESRQNQNVGQILNTCSILESVSYLEPSCVETVHIIDATSEPSDSETRSSTPNLDTRLDHKLSSSDDDDESEEYETGESIPYSNDHMQILKRQIVNEENRRISRNDSEQIDDQLIAPPKPQRKRLTPTLKEILSATTDRDSFYSADKEAFDEPLIFSDDEDNNHIDGQSTERCNRHTVLIDKTLKKKPKSNENQKIIQNYIVCDVF